MNGHPARPIAGEAFVGRDRERLHAFGVAWPSWHVHFSEALIAVVTPPCT